MDIFLLKRLHQIINDSKYQCTVNHLKLEIQHIYKRAFKEYYNEAILLNSYVICLFQSIFLLDVMHLPSQ